MSKFLSLFALAFIFALSSCSSDTLQDKAEGAAKLSGSLAKKKAMAKDLSSTSFKEEVLSSNQLVVVHFGSAWASTARQVDPLLDEILNRYGTKVLVGSVDSDENPDLVMEYSVRSFPTILILKNGEVVERLVGKTTAANLRQTIDEYL